VTIDALNGILPTNWRPSINRKIFEAMSRPRNLPPGQQVPSISKKIWCYALPDKLTQSEACRCYRKWILKKLTAPRLLGKNQKEAHHKTSWK